MKFKPFLFALVAVVAAFPIVGVNLAAGYGHALPPNPTSGLTKNNDGEPGIAVDGAGNYWIASNVLFNKDSRSADAFSGADIWESKDGGKTYNWIASPFGATSSTTGPAGEDSDITAAQQKNANGYYNVYATSLWVGSTSVAFSQDGGKTWTLDPLGGIPAEDRPWVAADGACTLYVAYHQLPTWEPAVNKYDLCTPSVGFGVAINPVTSTSLFESNSIPGLTNVFGKIQVDNSPSSPFRHNLYVPMQGCDLNGPVQIVQNLESTSGCVGKTQEFIGVSTDGGQTFSDYIVAEGTNGEQSVWCCEVGIDRAGNVYYAWTDNHNSYLATSRDGGKTWSTPVQLNHAGTAVYPTPAGGAPGVVKVAYYGATRIGDANDPLAMGNPNARGAAIWSLDVATSQNFGKNFADSTVVSPIHTGILCTQGSNCPTTVSRNLYDDFGAVIGPRNTLSIGYTSDQPGGQNTNVFTGFVGLG